MRKVGQSLLGERGEQGDCLRACLASILETDPSRMPHFAVETHWVRCVQKWIAENTNLCAVVVQTKPNTFPSVDDATLWVGCGPGPRGEIHAVVYRGRLMVWDPHESGAGLNNLEYAIFLLAKL